MQAEALLVFTRNAALLASTMPQEAVKKLIVPLLVRAADQGTLIHHGCVTEIHCCQTKASTIMSVYYPVCIFSAVSRQWCKACVALFHEGDMQPV